ncbi:MAG: 3D domain-containing protein [Acidobacteriota bacterium]|jgi:3D (Asp-Asp-Asp) domain-containing protein
MSFRLTSLAGVFSVMLLLQTIAGAQSAIPDQSAVQEKIFNSNKAGRLVLNPGERTSEKTDSSVLPVNGAKSAPVVVPNVASKNPTLEFKLVPMESSLSGIFSSPAWSLSETRSFDATAYSLKGVTRSGVYVRRGFIAADPSVLPLGSVVQVTAGKYTGVYTVEDTGGKIKGHIIDVWVPSRREALQFGRQKVKVEVIKMGLTRLRK